MIHILIKSIHQYTQFHNLHGENTARITQKTPERHLTYVWHDAIFVLKWTLALTIVFSRVDQIEQAKLGNSRSIVAAVVYAACDRTLHRLRVASCNKGLRKIHYSYSSIWIVGGYVLIINVTSMDHVAREALFIVLFYLACKQAFRILALPKPKLLKKM